MKSEILVKPNEAWEYFKENEKELATIQHCIASCEDFGVEIYLYKHEGFPVISVEADGTEIYTDSARSPVALEDLLKDAYDMFLSPTAVDILSAVNEQVDEDEKYEAALEYYDQSIEIEERETALDDLIWDFVSVATEGADGAYDNNGGSNFDSDLFTAEMLEDCKEHFLAYLYLKYKVNIYRPMIVQYEDGTEEYTEYPYDKLEIPNADSPVYK